MTTKRAVCMPTVASYGNSHLFLIQHPFYLAALAAASLSACRRASFFWLILGHWLLVGSRMNHLEADSPHSKLYTCSLTWLYDLAALVIIAAHSFRFSSRTMAGTTAGVKVDQRVLGAEMNHGSRTKQSNRDKIRGTGVTFDGSLEGCRACYS